MEAVLDFGRGCQKLAIILRDVRGGAEMECRPAPPYHIYRGGGGERGRARRGERENKFVLALNAAMCM
jgi:hypothetical protein